MNTIEAPETNQPTGTLPTQLVKHLSTIVDAVDTRQRSVERALGSEYNKITEVATPFAAEFAAYAVAIGAVSKTGNVKQSTVIEALSRAGATLPSQSVISRVNAIGNTIREGERAEFLATYEGGTWTQPADAVAEGAQPVVKTNTRSIEELAKYCAVIAKQRKNETHDTYLIVDDVLISKTEHAKLTKPVEPEQTETPAADGAEQNEQPEQNEPEHQDDEPAVEPEQPNNRPNLGALAAVFATCDAATVEQYLVYDMSEYDTREDLMALATSALAAVTLMDRIEAPATA